MTLEALSTAAAIGTFLVIAATAIAALIQLRHLRVSNQLQGLLAILSLPYEPILHESFEFVSHELEARLRDPEFRHELEKPQSIGKSIKNCAFSIITSAWVPS